MDILKKQNIFNEIIKIPNYLKTPFFFFIILLIIFMLFFPYQKLIVVYANNDNGNCIFYTQNIDILYDYTLYINNQKQEFYIGNIEKDPVNNINIVRVKINNIKNKIVKLTFKSKKITLVKEILNLLEKGVIS